jgi:hypothetical protein
VDDAWGRHGGRLGSIVRPRLIVMYALAKLLSKALVNADLQLPVRLFHFNMTILIYISKQSKERRQTTYDTR